MNPLSLSAQAVANATGKLTVTLPAPSLGTWWQAAVVVPTAPTGATLALYLAGGKELSWIGPQPSAAVVILASQTVKVEGSGFTAGQAVSVNLRGGWASGQPQGIAPAGPSGFTAIAGGTIDANISGPVTIETAPTKPVTTKFAPGAKVAVTGDVTLAAGTKVTLATGSTVALAATTKVGLAAGSEVKTATGSVTSIPSAASSASTFGVRSASAQDSASITTAGTLVPAPTAPARLQLFGASVSATTTLHGIMTTGGAMLLAAGYTHSKVFTFDGVVLAAGEGITSQVGVTATINYAVLT